MSQSRYLVSPSAMMLIFALAAFVYAQPPLDSQRSGAPVDHNKIINAKPQAVPTFSVAGMSEAQKALAESSKRAILATGITQPYFNQHFRLVNVFVKEGDRRVVWEFSVGEYVALVNDPVGFYLGSSGRVNVHSVANLLASTHDIVRTITRRRAERLMRECIGNFSGALVEYRADGFDNHAALLLTAQRVIQPKVSGRAEARERREREAREVKERAQKKGQIERDPTAEEDDERTRPIVITGIVNLETGKCKKGRALVSG